MDSTIQSDIVVTRYGFFRRRCRCRCLCFSDIRCRCWRWCCYLVYSVCLSQVKVRDYSVRSLIVEMKPSESFSIVAFSIVVDLVDQKDYLRREGYTVCSTQKLLSLTAVTREPNLVKLSHSSAYTNCYPRIPSLFSLRAK